MYDRKKIIKELRSSSSIIEGLNINNIMAINEIYISSAKEERSHAGGLQVLKILKHDFMDSVYGEVVKSAQCMNQT